MERQFASKSEEHRHKALVMTKYQDKTLKQALVSVDPVATGGFSVLIKIEDEAVLSQFCADKAAIIKFMNEVL